MTKHAAVIGYPISHSKSPIIHGYWIKKHGLDAAYDAVEVAPENLAERLKKFAADGYVGLNATLPHKEKLFGLCDEVDDIAKAIGAVNTISIKSGKIHGTNTDAFGFIENITARHPGFDFTAGPALVLGAGGASRAIVYALLQAGVPDIYLFNRTKSKAEGVAKDFGRVHVRDWDKRNESIAGANLLVNTTSMGMKGQPDLEIDLTQLPQNALVNDIVYAPLMTNLLMNAENRGHKIVTGIGMLLHQARPAFQSWFGIMPEVDAELEHLVQQ